MHTYICTGCGAAGVPAHGVAAAGRGRGGSGARAALQGALPYLEDKQPLSNIVIPWKCARSFASMASGVHECIKV